MVDLGANTLAHIAELLRHGCADRKGLRDGPLEWPNLSVFGLMHARQSRDGVHFPAGQCRSRKRPKAP